MAKNVLAVCLMFLVASSVILEVQGTFLLRHYMRKKYFPRRSMDFTPFACKGMLFFMSRLQNACPATREFKQFFTNLQSYVTYINTASTSSTNLDSEINTKCDGLVKALSATGVTASSTFRNTMLSMGKTLIQMRKSGSEMITSEQKRQLAYSMISWTKMVASFVKTASEKAGKSIDISSYGLDVDVNSAVGSGSESESDENTPTRSGSSPTGTESETSTKRGSGSTESETKKSSSGSGSPSTKTTSPTLSGSTSPSPSGSSPTAESKTSSESTTSETEGSSSGKTSATSVKQVETETSKEVMSFITELEKKYSQVVELKVFIEKFKASMTAFSTISTKTVTDYASIAKAATTKLAEAMTFLISKSGTSEKIESCQDQVMTSLNELQQLNSQILSERRVTSTQQTEIKQTITKLEQVTTQFVEVAASSSSSYSKQSMSKQSMASSQERTMVTNN